MATISLTLMRFDGLVDRAWAFAQMGLSRAALKRLPGVGFLKMLGSGTGEGFTPVPNFGVYAVLATWPDLAHARGQLAEAPVFRRYRGHASEMCSIHLETLAAKGEWDGANPFPAPADGYRQPLPIPFAVLTRATVKPAHAVAFWRHTPDVQAAVRAAREHMLLKIGMGEVPLVQQVTFSIWDDAAAMAEFAHRPGAHNAAVKDVREGHWFKEELYARFRVLAVDGAWEGRDPLSRAAGLREDPDREMPRKAARLIDVKSP